jgi:hypothetical protein
LSDKAPEINHALPVGNPAADRVVRQWQMAVLL